MVLSSLTYTCALDDEPIPDPEKECKFKISSWGYMLGFIGNCVECNHLILDEEGNDNLQGTPEDYQRTLTDQLILISDKARREERERVLTTLLTTLREFDAPVELDYTCELCGDPGIPIQDPLNPVHCSKFDRQGRMKYGCFRCPYLSAKLKKTPPTLPPEAENLAAYEQEFIMMNPEFLEID